jgi:hypothetical protein
VIPGLLQTQANAQALLPWLVAVLTEASLMYRWGSQQDRQAQVAHLAAMSRPRNVELRFADGPHPGRSHGSERQSRSSTPLRGSPLGRHVISRDIGMTPDLHQGPGFFCWQGVRGGGPAPRRLMQREQGPLPELVLITTSQNASMDPEQKGHNSPPC